MLPELYGVDNGQNSTRGLNPSPARSEIGPVTVEDKQENPAIKKRKTYLINIKNPSTLEEFELHAHVPGASLQTNHAAR